MRQHNVALLYTASSLFVSGCTMASGVLLVRCLPPSDIGIWQSVKLAITYSMFVLAGVNNGLSRELPYYMGKSEGQTSRLLASTSLAYLLAASALVLIGGLAGLVACRDQGAKLVAAIGAVTVLITITFYTNYLTVTFRSSRSFQDLTKVRVVEGVAGLATIPLFYYFGYSGMLIRVVGVAALIALAMHSLRPIHVRPHWSLSSFLLLLRTGAPIFALDYLSSIAATCDRLILLRLGGTKAVGIYAMALLAREAIDVVPRAVGEYVYPRMSYAYGQHHNSGRLWGAAVKSSLLVVAMMVPVAIIGWLLMPPVVMRLFPKYADGITAARLLLLAAIFSGATLGRTAIWSLKAWKLMVCYQAIGAGFTVAGALLGVTFCREPLVGVSAGLLTAQVVWCPVAWTLIYAATHPATETALSEAK